MGHMLLLANSLAKCAADAPPNNKWTEFVDQELSTINTALDRPLGGVRPMTFDEAVPDMYGQFMGRNSSYDHDLGMNAMLDDGDSHDDEDDPNEALLMERYGLNIPVVPPPGLDIVEVEPPPGFEDDEEWEADFEPFE